MRIIRVFSLIFLMTVPTFAAGDFFDVVFDLDWTLAYKTDAARAQQDPSGIFQFENEIYRVSPGAIEALRKLHMTEGIRVSFNSGGSTERNQALLQFIYEAVNEGRAEKPFAPYKVLNKDFLVENKTAKPTDPFPVRLKKTLTPIDPDLRKIILVDDISYFLVPDQQDHMLWTGSTFKDLLTYRDAVEARQQAPTSDQAYFPENELEYRLERQKIPRVTELILKAFRESPEAPVELLRSWTRDREGHPADLTRGGLRCLALF